MQLPPEMYLTSAEVHGLREPRLCIFLGCIPGESRPDWYIARVMPPIEAEAVKSRLPGPIEKILLAHKHMGFPIVKPREWPVRVYVVRALDDRVYRDKFLYPEQSEMIAWGELFATREDAEAFSKEWWDHRAT